MNYLFVARLVAIAAVLTLGVAILYEVIEPDAVQTDPRSEPS
jgi:hypothetical protein